MLLYRNIYSSANTPQNALYAWGNNQYSQIPTGNPSANSSIKYPIAISNFSQKQNVISFAAGDSSGAYVDETENLYYWGVTSNGTYTISNLSAVPLAGGNWQSVDFSGNTAFALKNNGTLWGWGNNSNLLVTPYYDVTSYYPENAQQIYGYVKSNNIVSVWSKVYNSTVNNGHYYAQKTDGSIWGWGLNTVGQIGDGSTVNKSSPVMLWSGSSNNQPFFKQIDIGLSHTVAVRYDDTIWAWGLNSTGQIGDGTTINRSSPVAVVLSYSLIGSGGTTNTFTSTATSVSAGASHSTAIDSTSSIWTWGGNASGQLGDGTTVNKSSPIKTYTNYYVGNQPHTRTGFLPQNNGTISWKALATNPKGTHFLGIKEDDSSLWGWGLNTSYQLGDGTIVSKSSPILINSSISWSKIYAGLSHSLAIAANNAVFAWGSNSLGQLGDGTTITKSTPVLLSTLNANNISLIDIGTDFTTYLASNGKIYATGLNSVGQIGDGTLVNKSNWTAVLTADSFTNFSVGESHTVALRGDGSLFTWGYNSVGQLGDGTVLTRSFPVQVVSTYSGIQSWKAVATAGGAHIGLSTQGRLYTWGTNAVESSYSPKPLSSSNSFTTVAAGDSHFVAISTLGELYSWGKPGASLGFGDTLGRTTPTQLGTSSWTFVAAESNHTFAISTTGALFAWGNNELGQLGDGTTIDKDSPVQIGSGSWSTVSTSHSHTAGITSTGALFTWGYNATGQLGDGTTIDKSSPVQVGSLSWTTVSAGEDHTAGIQAFGLYAWGNNVAGQIGDSTVGSKSSPTKIGALSWGKVAAGRQFTAATLQVSGALYTWGRNNEGQLGAGTTVNRSSPVQVGLLSYTFVSADDKIGTVFTIQTTGALYGWGNSEFSIGDGYLTSRSSPVAISTPNAAYIYTWTSPLAGGFNSGGFTIDTSNLYIWGNNATGQIGDTGTTSRSSPVLVNSTLSWKEVKLGATHTAALTNDGVLFTWGRNAAGQLGTGTTVNRTTPLIALPNTLQIIEGTEPVTWVNQKNWSNVYVAQDSTYVLFKDSVNAQTGLGDQLFGIGLNANGQLGDNSSLSRSSPVLVNAWDRARDRFSSFTSVSSGLNHSAALTSNNIIYTWGSNATGQLGDKSLVTRSTPVAVSNNFYYTKNSIFFRGTDTADHYDYLAPSGNNVVFDLGYNDFTIEAWFYLTVAPLTAAAGGTTYDSNRVIIQFGEVGNPYPPSDFAIYVDSNLSLKAVAISQFNPTLSTPSNFIVLNNWYHVAVTRQSNTHTLFVNGVSYGSANYPHAIRNRPNQPTIGQGHYDPGQGVPSNNGYSNWRGFISNLHIVKNQVLYSNTSSSRASFEPPKEIVKNANTILLITGDGSANNNIIDASNNQFTITRAGERFDGSFKIKPYVAGAHFNKVVAGSSHTVGLSTTKNLYTWGGNASGQLGDGSLTTRSSPVQISVNSIYELGRWNDISINNLTTAGKIYSNTTTLNTSIGYSGNNALFAWGSGVSGMVGDGFTLNRNSPVAITSLTASNTTNNSVFFDGNGDYLTVTTTANTQLRTSDFTIEAWIYYAKPNPNTTDSGAYRIISMNGPEIYIYSAGNASDDKLRYYNGGNDRITSSIAFTSNAWSHFAITRQSSNTRMYINGSIAGYWSVDSSDINPTFIDIGVDRGTLLRNFYGNISNLRILKGTALYTTQSFTVPTSALTAIANTVLLTCQSPTIVDNSTANNGTSYRVVTTGNAVARAFNPFTSSEWNIVTPGLANITGNTMYAWGLNAQGQVGDGTTVNKSTPVQIGSDYELRDVSFSLVSSGKNDRIAYAVGANTGNLYAWGTNVYGEIGLPFTGNSQSAKLLLPQLSQSSEILYRQSSWKHISAGTSFAVAIKADDSSLWAWGVNTVGQLGDGTTVNKSSPTLISANTKWKEVSAGLSHAIAINSSNRLYAWGLNSTGQLGDGTTINKSAPVLLSAGATYQSYSNFFNGNGDMIAVPDSASFTLGTNDFTLEYWVRHDVVPLTQVLTASQWEVSSRPDTNSSIGTGTSNKKLYGSLAYNNSTDQISLMATTTIQDYTWYHFAFVRSGNTFKVYVNGVNEATLSDFAVSINDSNLSWVIGQRRNGTMRFGGHISNLRLVNGTAVYTSNFTPPTSALTAIPNTVLLTCQSSTFIDNSPYNHIVAATGTPIATNSVTPYAIANTGLEFNIVSAGASHSVALISNANTYGNFYTWGGNASGQLGDGTTVNRSTILPVPTSRIYSSWKAISVGQSHALAIRSSDGALFAWGLGSSGQLGDGTTVAKSWATKIGISSWSVVSAGLAHSAGITTAGVLFTWGINSTGQLGDGTTINKSSPVNLGPNWSTVNAGFSHTIGTTSSNNQVYVWGGNASGQLGDNTLVNKSTPTILTGHTAIVTSAGATNSGTVAANNSLYVWGLNSSGQVGDGTTVNKSSPVRINEIYGNWSWKVIAASSNHIVAIRHDDTLWAWGLNSSGQLGDGTTINKSAPVQISIGTSWRDVAAGLIHTVAIAANNALFAWGSSSTGQLGDGTTVSKSRPVKIGTLSWTSVNVSESSTASLGITTTANLFTWGVNTVGQLGDGTTINRSSPVQIPARVGLYSWSAISSGSSHSIAIRSNDSSLWGWGLNSGGQLGDGSTINKSSPVLIDSGSWLKVAAGLNFTYAIAANNSLFAWGTNGTTYQLGDGTSVSKSRPVRLTTVVGSWTSVYASLSSTTGAGLLSNNALYMWGTNTVGQIGDGTTVNKSVPVRIADPETLISVSVGNSHTAGVFANNTVYAWGLNSTGQLGDGTTINKSRPVKVDTLESFSLVSAGIAHTLGLLTSNNTILSWGSSATGQLGDGTTINKSRPVKISSTRSFTNLSAGASHSSAVDSVGNLWLWGGNASAQLGDGTTVNKSSPVQVGYFASWSIINSGISNSSAIDTNGNLWLWGNNGAGALGDLTVVAKSHPVLLRSLNFAANGSQSWTSASIGFTHVTALQSDGSLWTWGFNGQGQLAQGPNDLVNRSSPVKVNTQSWTKVDAGIAHTLAISANNTLYAWGNNTTYQLGDNTLTNSGLPIDAKFANQLTPVNVNSSNNSLVLRGSTNYLMTTANDNLHPGQSGSEFTVECWIYPILTGFFYNVGFTSGTFANALMCQWDQSTGKFYFAQETTTSAVIAHSLTSTNTFTGNTWHHFAVVKSTDNVYRMYINGQLESQNTYTGTTTTGNIANFGGRNLAAGSLVGTQAATAYISNFRFTKSALYTANNQHPTQSLEPVANTHLLMFSADSYKDRSNNNIVFNTISGKMMLTGFSPWTTSNNSFINISAGGSHSMGVTSSNNLIVWGGGASGQLGENAILTRNIPVFVESPVHYRPNTSWSIVDAGISNSAAIDSYGNLFIWGQSPQGQLGDGTTVAKSSPVLVFTRNANTDFSGTWKDISIGGTHTAAITSANGLYVWGLNSSFQLGIGDGSTVGRSLPVLFSNNIIDVTAGSAQTLAVRENNELLGWGLNTSGQLGDNTLVNKSIAVVIGSSYTIVSSGLTTTLAISSNNSLYGWGVGTAGQIGDGTAVSKSAPVWAAGAAENYEFAEYSSWSFADASSTGNHTVGILNGTLYAWGLNSQGQLGDGTTLSRSAYNAVSTTQNQNPWYMAKVGGSHTVAIANNRTIWTWGLNSSGQLGDGTTINKSLPAQIGSQTFSTYSGFFDGSGDYLEVSNNSVLNFGTQDFTIEFWTYISSTQTDDFRFFVKRQFESSASGTYGLVWYTTGELKFSQIIGGETPQVLTSNANVTKGAWHHIAVARSVGILKIFVNGVEKGSGSWTTNVNNPYVLTIGDGKDPSNNLLKGYITNFRIIKGTALYTVNFATPTSALTAIANTSLLTLNSPTLTDTSGNGLTITKFGNVTLVNNFAPSVFATGGTSYGALTIDSEYLLANTVAAGDSHTLTINDKGRLYAWGLGTSGQLGDGTAVSKSSPVLVSTESGNTQYYWSDISAGSATNYAITANTAKNHLFAWGLGTSGQLGDNAITSKSAPVIVAKGFPSGNSIEKIVTTKFTAHLLDHSGGVFSVGDLSGTAQGLIGDTTVIGKTSPVIVPTLANSLIKDIVAGNRHIAAISANNSLYIWGSNANGQLGKYNLSIPFVNSPVNVGTFAKKYYSWKSIGLGQNHILGVREDGSLWSWGNNAQGQLGDGTTIAKSSPVLIGTSTWTSVSAGQYYSAGVSSNGAMYMWGLNTSGQLGDYTVLNKSTPAILKVGTANTGSVYFEASGNLILNTANTNSSLDLPGDFTIEMWMNSANPIGVAGGTNRMLLQRFGSSPTGSDGQWALILPGGLQMTGGVAFIYGNNQSAQFTGYGNIAVQEPNANKLSQNTWYHIAVTRSASTLRLFIDGNIVSTNNSFNINLTNDEILDIGGQYRYSNWSRYAGFISNLRIVKGEALYTANTTPPQSRLTATANTVLLVLQDDVVTDASNNKFILTQSGIVSGTGQYFVPGYNPFLNAANNISSISLRNTHTAAISNNTLYMWGINTSGQLGNGITITRSYPTTVDTELTPISYDSWKAISTSSSNSHTIAIRSIDSSLWAWGNNQFGQLGDGTTVSKSTPVRIGFSSWTAISAGNNITGAVATDGYAYTWGLNNSGQLGDGTTVNKSSPVVVPKPFIPFYNKNGIYFDGVGDYLTVTANSNIDILSTDFTVECWFNSLANAGVSNIRALGAQYRQTAGLGGWLLSLRPGNTIGFGFGAFSEASNILNSTTTWVAGKWYHVAITRKNRKFSMWINGRLEAVAFTTVTRATIAVNTTFGNYLNSSGVFPATVNDDFNGYIANFHIVKGTALYDESFIPSANVTLTANSTLLIGHSNTITNGANTILTLTTSGNVSNANVISVLADWSNEYVSISSGNNHMMAIDKSGGLYAWGNNVIGQIGDGTTISRSTPTYVTAYAPTTYDSWKVISASNLQNGHVLAIRSLDSSLWGWGNNASYQLGDGTTISKSSPTLLNSSRSWKSVSAGNYHSIALAETGGLYAWGNNAFGQIGDGTTVQKTSPIQIGSSSWAIVSAGFNTTIATKSDYTLYGWGLNNSGQLGQGDTINRSSPVQIAAAGVYSSWKSIATGRFHTLAIRNSDSSLWAWGYNGNGQLGDNTTVTKSYPVQIDSGSWLSVGAGWQHSIAAAANGVVYTWGWNTSGQLGDNTSVSRSTPATISTLINPPRLLQTNNSFYMNGSSHYIKIADNTNRSNTMYPQLRPSGDFTVEMWVYLTANNTSSGSLFTWGSAQRSPVLGINDLQGIVIEYNLGTIYIRSTGLSYTANFPGNRTLETNRWYHVALVRSANTLTAYVDGQAGAPVSNASGRIDPMIREYRDSNTAIWLSIKTYPEGPGGRTYASAYYNQIRFVSNSAVYTSNFTPSTSELENIANTQLLIKQTANTLYDASNNSFIIFKRNSTNFDSASEFNNPEGAIYATSLSPFSNSLSANAIFVTAGGNSSSYISNTNVLMTWGEGNYGQLGTNTAITRVLPSAVGDETWKFINFGKSALHTSAITTSNVLYTWGLNTYGQLGDGTTVSKSRPVLTNLSTTEMSEVSLGQWHSVAKSANNNVFAWGYNGLAQVGDGSYTNRSSPVKIGNIALRFVGIVPGGTKYNSLRFYSGQKHVVYFNTTGINVNPAKSLTVEAFVYLRDDDIGGPIVTHINNGTLQNALYFTLSSSANALSVSASTNNLYPWVGYCTNTNAPSTNWFGVGALNPITKNAWHHIAGVYSANTGEIAIYVNGTRDNYITRNWGSYTTEAGQQFRLGRNDQSNVNDAITFKGNISNFRLTLGNTLPYFGSSYTVPTAPLVGIGNNGFGSTNTIFLTAQSDRYVDNGYGTQVLPEIISGTINPQVTGENPFTTQYTPLSDTMTVGAGRWYSGAITNSGQLFMWGYNALGYLANNSTETLEYAEKIVGTTTWSKISLGEEAVTAVASNGSIFTWGSGQQDEYASAFPTYQLGDGTSYRSTPAMISSSLENPSYFVYDSWIYISAGANNIAAITTTNTLYTWGNNRSGQIGDGTTLSRSNPAQISSSWKAVSVGGSHMVAVDYTNKLYGWGNNIFGQIGDGSTISKLFPVGVSISYPSILNSGLNNSVLFSLYGGQANTSANATNIIGTNDYTIEMWFYPNGIPSQNDFNQNKYLFANADISAYYNNRYKIMTFNGNGGGFEIPEFRLSGTQLSTANVWNHVAFTRQGSTVRLYVNGILDSSSSNSSNITSNHFYIGRPYAYGDDQFEGYISNFRVLVGEALYTGNTYTVPTSAPGLNANTVLLLCAANTAIDSSNNNVTVTLSETATVNGFNPFQFEYPAITGISAGANSSAFVTQNIVLTTGLNTGSQLGDLSVTNRTTPVIVAQSGNTVSAGANNTYYIATNNYLYGWGSGNNGTIGDGTTISKSSPVLIASRASWSIVSSANDYTLGILTTGALYAWGKNNFGQHGDGTTLAKSSTVQIGTSSWSFVSAAANTVAALDSNKILFTWGRNNFGQLGDGTTIDKSSPVQIGTSSWTSVSMNDHALATTIDGALFAWGSNEYGSLGDNTITDKSSPIQIGTSSWTIVDAGFKASLAIDAQGELFAWGLNNGGQLGLGNVSNKSSPIQVGTTYKGYTPYSWTSVSVGDLNTVGLTSEGSLYTWGVNTVGQLGDGTTVSKSRPVKIGNSSWSFISAGPSHVAAIAANSALYAWGLNASGQLGDATTANRSSPVAVVAPLINYDSYSVVFDGTGDYLTVAANTALDLTGDFTIEFWQNDISGTGYICNGTQSGSGCWRITMVPGTGTVTWEMAINTWAGLSITSGSGGFVGGQWNHFAVTKENNTHRLFVNGNLVASNTLAGSLINTGRLTQIGIFTESTGSYYTRGSVSNLRILKGTALYTSNFTPPTSALTAIANTVLLTCQSPTFIDNSNNNFTISVAGNSYITNNEILTNALGTPFVNRESSSWKYVSAGFSATSAISSNDLLYVWGTSTGNTGILGLGTSITSKSSPALIGTSSWTMVNAGFGTMVGQTVYGNLYGWGNNVVGLINQYGPGNYGYGATNNAIFTPEQIGILNQISPTIIAAEGEGTLVMGVDSSGITHVLGAGLNDSGQLGNGTLVNNNYLEVVYKGNNRAQLYSGANTAYRIGEQGNTSIII